MITNILERIDQCLRFLAKHGGNHQGKTSCAFHPIRLLDFFYHQYYWKESSDLSFLHRKSHQGNAATETPTFWLLVVCFVSHPVRLKDSLTSNKTGKEHLISFNFFQVDNHKQKVAFQTTVCFGDN